MQDLENLRLIHLLPNVDSLLEHGICPCISNIKYLIDDLVPETLPVMNRSIHFRFEGPIIEQSGYTLFDTIDHEVSLYNLSSQESCPALLKLGLWLVFHFHVRNKILECFY